MGRGHLGGGEGEKRPRFRKGAVETPPVQSVERALSLLEAVAGSADPLPLARLTEILRIDPSSVFRLANTLKRRGFLANPNGRKDPCPALPSGGCRINTTGVGC